MSDREIDLSGPGPEMDMAVAQAIGISAGLDAEGALGCLRQQSDGTWTTFHPSTVHADCLLAMDGAKERGLFTASLISMWNPTLGSGWKEALGDIRSQAMCYVICSQILRLANVCGAAITN